MVSASNGRKKEILIYIPMFKKMSSWIGIARIARNNALNCTRVSSNLFSECIKSTLKIFFCRAIKQIQNLALGHQHDNRVLQHHHKAMLYLRNRRQLTTAVVKHMCVFLRSIIGMASGRFLPLAAFKKDDTKETSSFLPGKWNSLCTMGWKSFKCPKI